MTRSTSPGKRLCSEILAHVAGVLRDIVRGKGENSVEWDIRHLGESILPSHRVSEALTYSIFPLDHLDST